MFEKQKKYKRKRKKEVFMIGLVKYNPECNKTGLHRHQCTNESHGDFIQCTVQLSKMEVGPEILHYL